MSELADERDLGSRGAIRESSSLSFPTWAVECGSGSAVERLLAKEKAAGSNPVFRSSSAIMWPAVWPAFLLAPHVGPALAKAAAWEGLRKDAGSHAGRHGACSAQKGARVGLSGLHLKARQGGEGGWYKRV